MQAVTRGDGIRGDDVTANVKTVRSISLKLHGEDYPKCFEMRGEIVLPWTEFERLNKEREAQEEPLFANPRNAASGTLKQQNPQIVAARRLDAYLYYMLGEELLRRIGSATTASRLPWTRRCPGGRRRRGSTSA